MEEFIITFRESLEAALIIGIIFSYLKNSNKEQMNRYIYIGLFLGILGSIIVAILFHQLVGDFSGIAEQIFEGTTMILGAVMIVYLIVWMSKDTTKAIKEELQGIVKTGTKNGLLFLVFISILREGVETTIFLNALVAGQSSISLITGLSGLVAGVLAGYFVYLGLKGINLKYLFSISSALLILFATGLFARGAHELQEANIIPTITENIWNSSQFIDENSLVGSFAKSLFGYNSAPSLIEALVYISSLVLMVLLYNKNSLKPKKQRA